MHGPIASPSGFVLSTFVTITCRRAGTPRQAFGDQNSRRLLVIAARLAVSPSQQYVIVLFTASLNECHILATGCLEAPLTGTQKKKNSQKSANLLLKVKLVGNCPYSWSHNSFPSFQRPRPLVDYRGRRPRQPVNQTAAGHVRRKVVANWDSLVLAHGGKPAYSETAHEDTAENREKVANIHCHDSQHTICPLVPRLKSSAGDDCSQQVSNASDGRVNQCPDGINRKSPWSPNTVLLLNDGDIFFDAILGEDHFLSHAVG